MDISKLFDFSEVAIGDILTRICDKVFKKLQLYEAEVIAINDEIITCRVLIDIYRTMEFVKSTGVSTHGIDYGFIINRSYKKTADFPEEVTFVLKKFIKTNEHASDTLAIARHIAAN